MEKKNEFQNYLDKNPDKIELIDIKKEMDELNEDVKRILRENAIARQKAWESARKIFINC
jgi:thymidylate kinase